MARKLTIKTTSRPSIVVARPAIHAKKLVYIACANKAIKYKHGRSKIVYIGTTERGVRRIAQSAAKHAPELLSQHGIRRLEFYTVTCASRQSVQTWKKLERALILTFKFEFGEPPIGNRQGKNIFWKDESKYFTHRRLRTILEYYSDKCE